jgi:hypothetical protein
MNPAYYEPRYLELEKKLHDIGAKPLDRFIPEEHPDGAKGITYGQVGSRDFTPRGAVRYLQVINIRDTGIDFSLKPDRVAEASRNDPGRSRVKKDDILLTNTAFRGTDTLIGRCVIVHRDLGKLNISQDIDRVRVVGASPYYVGSYLKTPLAQMQIQRRLHGVDSQKISFGQIRSLLIPDLSEAHQVDIEKQYLEMASFHDRSMAIKERLLEQARIDPGRFGEAINRLAEEKPAYRRNLEEAKKRLDHLLTELVAVIEGRQQGLRPYPG